MQDLGTLGGTVALPTYDGSGGLNERGEVIGLSFLSGDRRFHPFLWDNGRMQDLGTLGGVVGLPTNINQAGDVVGWTLMTGNRTAHAFLWTDKNGLQDLGTLAGQPCSYADGINARGQIVGGSCTGPNGDEGDGWVWQDGALHDLNDMIAPSSSLTQIRQANTINDRGEIAAVGIVNGHKHVILLAPSELAESEGLRSNLPVSATGATAAGRSSTSVQVNLLPLLGRSRSRWSYLPAG
jgi:probable HAF family extracellular repeat protein